MTLLSSFLSTIQAISTTVYSTAVRAPLRRLYFEGPSAWGAGFWAGQQRADICAQLTQFNSDFWVRHTSECTDLIDQRFRSFVVSAEVTAYSLLLYKCISSYLMHAAVIRPIVQELRAIRRSRSRPLLTRT